MGDRRRPCARGAAAQARSIPGKLLGHLTRSVEQVPVESLVPVERRGALEMRSAATEADGDAAFPASPLTVTCIENGRGGCRAKVR
jgi:hypothetical protein